MRRFVPELKRTAERVWHLPSPRRRKKGWGIKRNQIFTAIRTELLYPHALEYEMKGLFFANAVCVIFVAASVEIVKGGISNANDATLLMIRCSDANSFLLTKAEIQRR